MLETSKKPSENIEKNKKIYNVDSSNVKFDPNVFFKKGKEKCYYKMLNSYFRKECKKNDIKNMVDIINGHSQISLRVLDWFITKYSKDKDIIINNGTQKFDVYISYKSQLKSYKKKNFDPFRRREKFNYNYDKNNSCLTIKTTLGQLNFFKWAIKNNIIEYVEKNIELITFAMNLSNKQKKIKKPIKKNKTISSKPTNNSWNNSSLKIISDKKKNNNFSITLSFD